MAADEDDCVSYALRMCSACWTDETDSLGVETFAIQV
jgi:hypothetical protein